MTTSLFIHESEVYRLLSRHGIKVPKFETDLNHFSFGDGEAVVVKGLAKDLWHKSDEGALHFISFSKDEVKRLDHEMKDQLGKKYEWIETMVCSKARFKTVTGLPCEAYVSIQTEDACDTVISFGVGGIHAEAWARELKSKILMWSPEFTTPEEALNEIEKHWIGKIWLGKLRQSKALTERKKILSFLNGLWEIAHQFEENKMTLLEMNPIVIDEDGELIALDGVGTYDQHLHLTASLKKKMPLRSLLSPKTMAIAGVSEKVGSFGLRILQNLIHSNIGPHNIKVIKSGRDNFLGVECYPDIKSLKNHPVDILILTLPAAITVETLVELCEQGGGAEIVYLVAGGIGDGGDMTGLASKIQVLLSERRQNGLWTPRLIGPNSLGIVLSSLNLSTLFIAPEKLPLKFHAAGNIAFISQSGAFFITRFSKDEDLPIKYGFCIGNQMDLKVSDFLEMVGTDQDLKVIGIYLEGFSTHEAIRLARASLKLISRGFHIVLYKGGRSIEGMKAAAGHTGAMAGNYELQKKILEKAGIQITHTFSEFSTRLNFLSAYSDFKSATKVSVISNAGFETVASADLLGDRIFKLDEKTKFELHHVLSTHGLSELIGVSNPLDLTPMADSSVYLECADVFAHSETDAIIYSAVPITDKLETNDLILMRESALKLKNIYLKYKKPILVVIDSGHLFDNYREVFKNEGLPIFKSIEEAFLVLC